MDDIPIRESKIRSSKSPSKQYAEIQRTPVNQPLIEPSSSSTSTPRHLNLHDELHPIEIDPDVTSRLLQWAIEKKRQAHKLTWTIFLSLILIIVFVLLDLIYNTSLWNSSLQVSRTLQNHRDHPQPPIDSHKPAHEEPLRWLWLVCYGFVEICVQFWTFWPQACLCFYTNKTLGLKTYTIILISNYGSNLVKLLFRSNKPNLPSWVLSESFCTCTFGNPSNTAMNMTTIFILITWDLYSRDYRKGMCRRMGGLVVAFWGSASLALSILYLELSTYDQLVLGTLLSLFVVTIGGYFENYIMGFWEDLILHKRFVWELRRTKAILVWLLLMIVEFSMMITVYFIYEYPQFVGEGICKPCTANLFLKDYLGSSLQSLHFLVLVLVLGFGQHYYYFSDDHTTEEVSLLGEAEKKYSKNASHLQGRGMIYLVCWLPMVSYYEIHNWPLDFYQIFPETYGVGAAMGATMAGVVQKLFITTWQIYVPMPYLWRKLRWVRYGDIEPVSKNDIFKYIKLDGVRMHHEVPRTVDDVCPIYDYVGMFTQLGDIALTDKKRETVKSYYEYMIALYRSKVESPIDSYDPLLSGTNPLNDMSLNLITPEHNISNVSVGDMDQSFHCLDPASNIDTLILYQLELEERIYLIDKRKDGETLESLQNKYRLLKEHLTKTHVFKTENKVYNKLKENPKFVEDISSHFRYYYKGDGTIMRMAEFTDWIKKVLWKIAFIKMSDEDIERLKSTIRNKTHPRDEGTAVRLVGWMLMKKLTYYIVFKEPPKEIKEFQEKYITNQFLSGMSHG